MSRKRKCPTCGRITNRQLLDMLMGLNNTVVQLGAQLTELHNTVQAVADELRMDREIKEAEHARDSV